MIKMKKGKKNEVELRVEQMRSEPNLWKIVIEDQDEEEEFISNGKVKGLLMTYVDDLCVSAEAGVAEAVVEALRRMWETSEPEEIGKDPTRFSWDECEEV